jgi:hypothetical protein
LVEKQTRVRDNAAVLSFSQCSSLTNFCFTSSGSLTFCVQQRWRWKRFDSTWRRSTIRTRIGFSGCRYGLLLVIRYQTLISAKKLLTAYHDTTHNLTDAVTDVENQIIINRIISQENKELHSKFEGLQRSIVSRTQHQRPTGAYIDFRTEALLFWY